MSTQNLLNLKIHKLSKESYENLENNNQLDSTAIYLTPDDSADTFYVTAGQIDDTDIGVKATAEGYNTNASGEYSHAEGKKTTATEEAAHAEGSNTWATGQFSHAEGEGTLASGKNSHAEGYLTAAIGDYSHAEGESMCAAGRNVTDSMSYDEVKGSWDYMEFSVAKGIASHAEGRDTVAYGDYSHAEGRNTIAGHEASHAAGYHTQTSRINQTVVGEYNTDVPDALFIVGDGYESEEDTGVRTIRSNAFVVYEGGSIGFKLGGTFYKLQIGTETDISANTITFILK